MDVSAITTVALSLLSAVVATVLTHRFAESRARRSELADMQLRAYTDFIKSASALAVARRIGKVEDELDQLTTLNDAKVRLCISAPPSVLKHLSEFWLGGGSLELEGEILAFTRLCNAMRVSLGNEHAQKHHINLSDIFFKVQPSSYSYELSKYSKNSEC